MVARKKKDVAAPTEGWGEDPAIRASPEDRQPPEGANAHGIGPDTEGGPNPDYQPPEVEAVKSRKRVKTGSSEAEAAPLTPDQMGDNARKVLIGFVERFERLDEERKAVMDDQKELLAEIKGAGFDKVAFRKAITRRKMDAGTRAEADALLDLYESVIG